MRVLYVMGRTPLPATSGDAHRNWALLKAARRVATRLDLVTLPMADGPGAAEGRRRVEALCDAVHVVGRPVGEVLGSPTSKLLTLAGRPYYAGLGGLPDVRETLRRVVADTDPDVVVLSQLYLAGALPPEVLSRTVYDSHNVHHLRLAESLRALPLPGALRQRVVARVHDEEVRLLNAVPVAVACSDTDAEELRRMAPAARVETVSNGVDVPEGAPVAPAPGARPLFLASLDATANIEGLAHLVDEILPLLPPGVVVDVAGSNPRPVVERIVARAGRRANLLGQVPDARATMRAACALLVPLRTGGGTRLKVLEAFAVGTPVVSTSKGVEGIPLRTGEHALVADTPAAFAAAVASLVGGGEVAARVVGGARDLVRAGYEWSTLGDRFAGLLSGVGARDGALRTVGET